MNLLNHKPKLVYSMIDTTLPPPSYAHPGDSGFDLYAAETVEVGADPVAVRTGVRFKIPKGYEIQLRPRSSMALKRGFYMPNSPGTIDSGYRGEVIAILTNPEGEKIHHGDKIVQGVLVPVQQADLQPGLVPVEGPRGGGGFGSTGR